MSEQRRLGRYELLERLGEGGMGAVWLARLTGTGGFEKLCIVKTVLPNIASDKQFVSRFMHEGRVLTQLQHSNIAQVHDMSEDGGTLFLALEYVPGVDLSRLSANVRASGQAVPIPVALYVMQQVAEGLGFAHRKTSFDGKPLGVVHRDVSPQNIMVSYDGEVKVIDFGIAKSEARSHATAQALVMGKLGYMAPEQARGDPVDHRADQYAAAVVLWELLTSAPFVPRGTLTEMVVAMATPSPKPVAPLRPEVPPSVEAVVMKALAPEAGDRFATTDDFARALMDELLRLTGLPTRLEIGAYVRANCSGEYAAQQTLMTRVGSRGTAPSLEQAAPTRPIDSEGRVGATFLRDPARATPGAEPLRTTPARPAAQATPTGVAAPSAVAQGAPTGVVPPPSAASAAGPVPPRAAPASPGFAPEVAPFFQPSSSTPGATGAPMSTAQLSAAAIQPNRTPLFVVAGVVAVALLAAGAWVVWTQVLPRDASPVPTSEPTAPPATPTTPSDTAELAPSTPPPTVDPGAPLPPPTTVAGVLPTVAAVVEGQTVEVQRAVDIFKDGEAWYARAGSKDSLQVGQMLTVVGPAGGGSKRPKLGTATVMEVFPQMARIVFDSAASSVAGDRFIALGEVKVTEEAAEGGLQVVEVSKAVELFTDGEKTYARAGSKGDALQVGQLLTIVGPAAEGNKRAKLGTATVMEVQPLMSRVTLDLSAKAATGDKFAAIGAVKPVAGGLGTGAIEVKKAAELFTDASKLYVRSGKNDNLQVGQMLSIVGPAGEGNKRQKYGTATVMEVFPLMARITLDAAAQKAPEPRFAAIEGGKAEPAGATDPRGSSGSGGGGRLVGRMRLQTTPLWAVVITNTSGFTWTSCSIYIPGKKKGFLKSINSGFTREFDLRYFTADAAAPVLNDAVQVSCKEGSVTFPAK